MKRKEHGKEPTFRFVVDADKERSLVMDWGFLEKLLLSFLLHKKD